MTHNYTVIKTGKQRSAVPTGSVNLRGKTIPCYIHLQVLKGNRVNLHSMDPGPVSRHGYSEVPDTGKHIGHAFIAGPLADDAGHPGLFAEISLCEHHFARIKIVFIPVFPVADFSDTTPHDL